MCSALFCHVLLADHAVLDTCPASSCAPWTSSFGGWRLRLPTGTSVEQRWSEAHGQIASVHLYYMQRSQVLKSDRCPQSVLVTPVWEISTWPRSICSKAARYRSEMGTCLAKISKGSLFALLPKAYHFEKLCNANWEHSAHCVEEKHLEIVEAACFTPWHETTVSKNTDRNIVINKRKSFIGTMYKGM